MSRMSLYQFFGNIGSMNNQIDLVKMATKHMKHFSDEELAEKRGKYTPATTIRSNKNANSIMVKYLEECGYENTDYLHHPTEELNKILCKFWFAVCKQKK